MAKHRTERLAVWKFQLLYPDVRRKDAGYLANVLSEYAAFSRADRRRLTNFDDVERCASALLRALNETPHGDNFRAMQLKAALEDAPSPGSGESVAEPDPIANRAWLQGYMRQVFEVENAVLQLQSFAALVARAPFLMERFRTVADDKVDYLKRQYDQELSSEKLAKLWETAKGEPNADASHQGPDERWLRAKLTSLLNDIHWWYAQSQVREELFLGQQLTVIAAFIVMSLALLIAFAAGCANCSNKLTVAVMFFGLLGGFTSVMRRMRSDTAQHGGGSEGSYKELTAFAYGKIGITFSLVFGMIFSLVLLLLFSAGLERSVFSTSAANLIFPTLPIPWSGDGTCSAGCLFGLAPGSGGPAKELAKLFVWAFLAGFAETLVPDALDRLTKAADSKKQS